MRPSRWRAISFRAGAVLVGLSLVLCFEGLLRLTPLGRFEDFGDPYVGFSDVVPLFVLNALGDRYEIPSSRQVFFRPDSFSAEKADNEFRIFCFGGSTVQGRPYAIETSFTRWLELSLTAADPDRKWRVVNCGGVSYASYRLLPILKETLAYEPDMFIVYSGQNEFLEERTYAEIKYEHAWIKAIRERATKWRIYGIARQLLRSAEASPTTKADLSVEVEALLDHQGGLEEYHRDDQWTRGVIEHYEHNLRRMVHLARDARVPLLLANPVSNIRDCAPFKVELSAQLSAEQRNAFERAWDAAKEASWEDLTHKLTLAQSVVDIDPRHAEAQFLLAKVREAKGDFEQARRAYYRAKDEDICPLRMTESMHSAVHRVAKQAGTTLIDVRKWFEENSETGVPGDDQLIDHVHPRIDGHQAIAQLFLDYLAEKRVVVRQPGWEERRDQLFRENYSSLPSNYFPESVSRLEGLQGWARGRSMRMKLQSRLDDVGDQTK